MKIKRVPRLVERIFPGRVWDLYSPTERILYLTFDDGPAPQITEWVLDTLSVNKAKATFFCVGENVQRYPALFERITIDGHTVGNHTMNHVNGWNTKCADYVENVFRAAELIPSKLFRPPYGRMTRQQAKVLSRDFDIIMWRFLTFDFNPKVDMYSAFSSYISRTKSGDIIVLHDNAKSFDQMKQFLLLVLDWGQKNGVRFAAIPSGVCK